MGIKIINIRWFKVWINVLISFIKLIDNLIKL